MRFSGRSVSQQLAVAAYLDRARHAAVVGTRDRRRAAERVFLATDA